MNYPNWLLLMFGCSFAALFVFLVGILIEGVVNFPEPPVFMSLAAAIALTANLASLYLADKLRRKRK